MIEVQKFIEEHKVKLLGVSQTLQTIDTFTKTLNTSVQNLTNKFVSTNAILVEDGVRTSQRFLITTSFGHNDLNNPDVVTFAFQPGSELTYHKIYNSIQDVEQTGSLTEVVNYDSLSRIIFGNTGLLVNFLGKNGGSATGLYTFNTYIQFGTNGLISINKPYTAFLDEKNLITKEYADYYDQQNYNTLNQSITDKYNELIQKIGFTALEIEAIFFSGTTPSTGSGSYAAFMPANVKNLGTAFSISANSEKFYILKAGMFEVTVNLLANIQTVNTCVSRSLLKLSYLDDQAVRQIITLNNLSDTNGDETFQVLYSIFTVESTWTDVYLTVERDSNYSSATYGSIKSLGNAPLGTLSIINESINVMAASGQTWPKISLATLKALNVKGTETWSIQPGGTFTGASLSGNQLTLTFADPGTFSQPITTTLNVRVVDGGGRIANKTINIILSPYSAQALSITNNSLLAFETDSYPATFDIYMSATGGSGTPYTWDKVAANTTLPNLTITGNKFTFEVSDAGTWTLRAKVTDPSLAEATKDITVTVETLIPRDDSCFEENTYVLMADKTSKKIKYIQAGDKVLSIKDKTFENNKWALTESLVTDVLKHEGEFKLQSLNSVQTTNEHLWATFNDRYWKHVIDISNSDKLVSFNEKYLPVSVSAFKLDLKVTVNTVWNISTLNNTYFVSKLENGPWFLVHNFKTQTLY